MEWLMLWLDVPLGTEPSIVQEAELSPKENFQLLYP
jgi:hypothetical protein